MKLHEITGSQLLTNKEDIYDWLKRENCANVSRSGHKYTIHNDLSVSVTHNFSIERKTSTNTIKRLPVNFKSVSGNFNVSSVGLTAIDGFPANSEEISMYDNPITSLIGISDIIKSCQEIEFDYCSILEGGLGLLLVENLRVIRDRGPNNHGAEAFKIIQKYLGTDNIIECQSELIEAGFEEYAVL